MFCSWGWQLAVSCLLPTCVACIVQSRVGSGLLPLCRENLRCSGKYDHVSERTLERTILHDLGLRYSIPALARFHSSYWSVHWLDFSGHP